jgi:phosphoglycolate phosphatase-like HAD superfamily hydrolase
MRFELVIFDFDGTLVDSNSAKYDAFFSLFPSDAPYRSIVRSVLEQRPEASREIVVPEMIQRMRADGLPAAVEMQADAKIRLYGDLTDEAVGKCPELPGASGLLRALHASSIKVAISSNTPHATLRRLVAARGWMSWLVSATGTPATKTATAARLLAENGVAPERAAVVGDGRSDRESAEAVGAAFFAVRRASDLEKLGKEWGVLDV